MDGNSEIQSEEKVQEYSPAPYEGRFARYAKKLGEGAEKIVYKAIDLNFGRYVAWNEVSIDHLTSDQHKQIEEEVLLLRSVDHPNIIDFYGGWATDEKVVFITEIVQSGDLQRFYRSHKLKLKVIKKWCRQILSALHYLHTFEPTIIHRDVKCENILYASDGTLKIGDLGLSTRDSGSVNIAVLGTPNYMAPEQYEGKCTYTVDIYAFGMCVLEMVTGRIPYDECTNAAQIFKKVINNVLPASIATIKYPSIIEFIELCIVSSDDFKRPTALELLNHPFLDENMHSPEDEMDHLIHDGLPEPVDISPSSPTGHHISTSSSSSLHASPRKDENALPNDVLNPLSSGAAALPVENSLELSIQTRLRMSSESDISSSLSKSDAFYPNGESIGKEGGNNLRGKSSSENLVDSSNVASPSDVLRTNGDVVHSKDISPSESEDTSISLGAVDDPIRGPRKYTGSTSSFQSLGTSNPIHLSPNSISPVVDEKNRRTSQNSSVQSDSPSSGKFPKSLDFTCRDECDTGSNRAESKGVLQWLKSSVQQTGCQGGPYSLDSPHVLASRGLGSDRDSVDEDDYLDSSLSEEFGWERAPSQSHCTLSSRQEGPAPPLSSPLSKHNSNVSLVPHHLDVSNNSLSAPNKAERLLDASLLSASDNESLSLSMSFSASTHSGSPMHNFSASSGPTSLSTPSSQTLTQAPETAPAVESDFANPSSPSIVDESPFLCPSASNTTTVPDSPNLSPLETQSRAVSTLSDGNRAPQDFSESKHTPVQPALGSISMLSSVVASPLLRSMGSRHPSSSPTSSASFSGTAGSVSGAVIVRESSVTGCRSVQASPQRPRGPVPPLSPSLVSLQLRSAAKHSVPLSVPLPIGAPAPAAAGGDLSSSRVPILKSEHDEGEWPPLTEPPAFSLEASSEHTLKSSFHSNSNNNSSNNVLSASNSINNMGSCYSTESRSESVDPFLSRTQSPAQESSSFPPDSYRPQQPSSHFDLNSNVVPSLNAEIAGSQQGRSQQLTHSLSLGGASFRTKSTDGYDLGLAMDLPLDTGDFGSQIAASSSSDSANSNDEMSPLDADAHAHAQLVAPPTLSSFSYLAAIQPWLSQSQVGQPGNAEALLSLELLVERDLPSGDSSSIESNNEGSALSAGQGSCLDREKSTDSSKPLTFRAIVRFSIPIGSSYSQLQILASDVHAHITGLSDLRHAEDIVPVLQSMLQLQSLGHPSFSSVLTPSGVRLMLYPVTEIPAAR